MRIKTGVLSYLLFLFYFPTQAQILPDSTHKPVNYADSALRINKNQADYYWYLKNSPVGLKIDKDNGVLTFKAEKSYFLSGRLKYDYEYKVNIGIQNLNNS